MIDGNDVKELNLKWLRRQIGIVSQEPVLFDLSVRDNIAYGDTTREVSDQEVKEAARVANIHQFITSLPEVKLLLLYNTRAGVIGKHHYDGILLPQFFLIFLHAKTPFTLQQLSLRIQKVFGFALIIYSRFVGRLHRKRYQG